MYPFLGLRGSPNAFSSQYLRKSSGDLHFFGAFFHCRPIWNLKNIISRKWQYFDLTAQVSLRHEDEVMQVIPCGRATGCLKIYCVSVFSVGLFVMVKLFFLILCLTMTINESIYLVPTFSFSDTIAFPFSFNSSTLQSLPPSSLSVVAGKTPLEADTIINYLHHPITSK